MRKPLLRALKMAEIKAPFTVHGLRRTFNNLARQVTSCEVVRSITGHVTNAMTEHYSHIAIAEKRAAVARVLRLLHENPPKWGIKWGIGCGQKGGPRKTSLISVTP